MPTRARRLFPTGRQVGEFVDWYAWAKTAGLVMTLMPEVLAHRRIHGGNHTLRQKAHLTDYAGILKAAIDQKLLPPAAGEGVGRESANSSPRETALRTVSSVRGPRLGHGGAAT